MSTAYPQHEAPRLLSKDASSIGATVDLSERIIFIDGEAIVIDKPAGLPVDTPRRGGDFHRIQTG